MTLNRRLPPNPNVKLPRRNATEEITFRISSIERWFRSRPILFTEIKWQESDGTLTDYYSWSRPRQKFLKDLIITYCTAGDTNLNEAHPNAPFIRRDGDLAIRTEWTHDVALSYFLAHVAHCLTLDFFRSLPWSLSSYPVDQRAVFLDGRQYFRLLASRNYEIDREGVGHVTYGDPKRIYNFILRNRIIGDNHKATIVNLLEWCSRNLNHHIGDSSYTNAFAHWQYEGFPPIERMINGTIREIYNERRRVQSHTLGCGGTTGFLRAVLRLANIPVVYRRLPSHGHAFPYFISINEYIAHGDDPYTFIFSYIREVPLERILIDHDTFIDWFTDPANARLNLSRRILDLAIEYLPFSLMVSHCQNTTRGLPLVGCEIVRWFSTTYSFEYLNSVNLWRRLDDKITAFGGCMVVIDRYYEITTVP